MLLLGLIVLICWNLLVVVIFLLFFNTVLSPVDTITLSEFTQPLFVVAERLEIVVPQELFYNFDQLFEAKDIVLDSIDPKES